MIFVLLPALNEAEALSRLIPDIGRTLQKAKLSYQIVLVDDGSSDKTPELVAEWKKSWPLEHLRHTHNRGYGAALKTGYLWIAQNAMPEDIVVSLDSDNTHSPDYIPQLVKKIEEGFDVVTASYWMKGGRMTGVPFQRQVMSFVVNTLLRVLKPMGGVRCYTNGFRAYRVSALRKVRDHYGDHLIEHTGFPGGAELFIKAGRLGAKAGEIPFVLHYENRGAGSKIRLVSTILGYLKLLRL